jgi:beta-barrel assembly-enhancing protease
MKRRHWLAAGCAQCAALGTASWWPALASAQPEPAIDWQAPARFTRPDVATDEGGLWALMDREEARLRRSPFLMRDPALRDYLQGIACRLGADHCLDLRIYSVRTPHFNASMAPNGMMQVWSGLLLRVENEAQLAAVLGHEIGHYLQRHQLGQLRDAKSRSAFGTFMAAFGAVGLVGQLAAIAGMFSFSREQEREADRIGLVLMARAGYDPREASKVWANLLAEVAATPGNDPTKTNPLFASHPPSEERRTELARRAADTAGGALGETEYGHVLAPFQRDLLDDELQRRQTAETLVLIDRLLGRQPRRADLLYYRGEARRGRDAEGDLDAALTDFQAAAALGGEPPELHRALGYVHQKRAQLPQARAAFARYVELAPNAPDVALIRSYLTESPP